MNREAFISKVIVKYPSSEISATLQKNPLCKYYELCQNYLDVALNAHKFPGKDGSLVGEFLDADIDVAIENTRVFILDNDILDLDEFFDILQHTYPDSLSPTDKRKTSIRIMIDDNVGRFYPLTRIPSNNYSKIVDEVKSRLL